MISHARYTESGAIAAMIAGAEIFVPNTFQNRHRQMLEQWQAEGNVIEPWSPPAPTREDFRFAIQAHVDAVAQAHDYNDGNALAGYANSTNPLWAAQSGAFIAWRDAVWEHAHAELDNVTAGVRATPTVADFVAELPVIEWPD